MRRTSEFKGYRSCIIFDPVACTFVEQRVLDLPFTSMSDTAPEQSEAEVKPFGARRRAAKPSANENRHAAYRVPASR
jgi:hypothetical protein